MTLWVLHWEEGSSAAQSWQPAGASSSSCSPEALRACPVTQPFVAAYLLLQVDVYPNGIKQHPGVRCEEPVIFEIEPSMQLRYQFIPRLERLLRLSDAAQQEFPSKLLGITNYLLRPSSKTGDNFEEKPWSTSK